MYLLARSIMSFSLNTLILMKFFLIPISGLQPNKPNSVVHIKTYYPKVNIFVNTKSNLQLYLTHIQTKRTAIIKMGMFYPTFERNGIKIDNF